MRVLTLKQPWAELIKRKIKYIETRSWKTNYRGPLYIHASKGKIKLKEIRNKEILDYINQEDLEYGAIIAKCHLKDCVYMDDNFIKYINNVMPEYLCGRYEEGRYAWLLDDIEPLKSPIYTNGQLGIWHYKE